jgi:hypothetical protein
MSIHFLLLTAEILQTCSLPLLWILTSPAMDTESRST